jgi:hypothetical protein
LRIVSSDCAVYDRRMEAQQLGTLLDSEGTVTINLHRKTDTIQSLVSVGMTRDYYPKLLHRRYGGSYSEAPPSQKRKQVTYIWRVNGKGCERPLRDCYLYLMLKRINADLVLGFVETIRPHHKTSLQTQLVRFRLLELMQKLNQKGRAHEDPDEIPNDDEEILQEETELEDEDDDD